MSVNFDLYFEKLLELIFLEEFAGKGDVTTDSFSFKEKIGKAQIIAKEAGVFCGGPFALRIFKRIDPELRILLLKQEGELFVAGESVIELRGRIESILKGERMVLNLISHLSGIATMTRKMVNLLEGTSIILLDTRKTLPGLRALEKYAVRVGGGKNHRFGLFDGILVKDNHVKLAGSVEKAIQEVKRNAPMEMKIEVEVETLEELKRALEAGVDIVLLDNFNDAQLEQAGKILKAYPQVKVEVSGGITVENIVKYKKFAFIDYLSSGSITHSVKAIDFSLEVL